MNEELRMADERILNKLDDIIRQLGDLSVRLARVEENLKSQSTRQDAQEYESEKTNQKVNQLENQVTEQKTKQTILTAILAALATFGGGMLGKWLQN